MKLCWPFMLKSTHEKQISIWNQDLQGYIRAHDEQLKNIKDEACGVMRKVSQIVVERDSLRGQIGIRIMLDPGLLRCYIGDETRVMAEYVGRHVEMELKRTKFIQR